MAKGICKGFHTRNQKIREAFKKLDEQKKYKLDWMLSQLSEQFYLSSDTIYLIVREVGYYKADAKRGRVEVDLPPEDPRQLKMFG